MPTGIFLLLRSNIFSVEPALPVTLCYKVFVKKKGIFSKHECDLSLNILAADEREEVGRGGVTNQVTVEVLLHVVC